MVREALAIPSDGQDEIDEALSTNMASPEQFKRVENDLRSGIAGAVKEWMSICEDKIQQSVKKTIRDGRHRPNREADFDDFCQSGRLAALEVAVKLGKGVPSKIRFPDRYVWSAIRRAINKEDRCEREYRQHSALTDWSDETDPSHDSLPTFDGFEEVAFDELLEQLTADCHTSLERDVLAEWAKGVSANEIAKSVGRCWHTIKDAQERIRHRYDQRCTAAGHSVHVGESNRGLPRPIRTKRKRPGAPTPTPTL